MGFNSQATELHQIRGKEKKYLNNFIELFKEYSDISRIFVKFFLYGDKSPTVPAMKKASQFQSIGVRNCVCPLFLSQSG